MGPVPPEPHARVHVEPTPCGGMAGAHRSYKLRLVQALPTCWVCGSDTNSSSVFTTSCRVKTKGSNRPDEHAHDSGKEARQRSWGTDHAGHLMHMPSQLLPPALQSRQPTWQ